MDAAPERVDTEDSLRHLIYATDSAHREDIATNIGLDLVARAGLAAVTPASVAARAGCSRQAVHQWFGGHEELRRVVARVFGVRWRRWVEARVYFHGITGLLPESEEVTGWCRVWLALVEHAPRDPEIATVVDAVRYTERVEIAAALGSSEGSDLVALIHSSVEGLRARLCVGDGELSAERARRILDLSQGGKGSSTGSLPDLA